MDPVKTPVGPIGGRDVTSVEGETRTARPGADVGDEGGA